MQWKYEYVASPALSYIFWWAHKKRVVKSSPFFVWHKGPSKIYRHDEMEADVSTMTFLQQGPEGELKS